MRYELPDGLYAELHVEFFPEYDAVSWVIYYGNNGKNDSLTLSKIRDCAIDIPVSPDPPRHPGAYPTNDYAIVSSATGMVEYDHKQNAENEFRFLDYPLLVSQKLTRTPEGGLSSSGTLPFFEINHGNTGVLLAIGWTGQWKAVFTRENDCIKAETGIDGAEFTSFWNIAQQLFRGDFWGQTLFGSFGSDGTAGCDEKNLFHISIELPSYD